MLVYLKKIVFVSNNFFWFFPYRVSPFDFPILSFFVFVLNQMLCFNSTMYGEICAMSVETYVLNLFPSKWILCNGIKVFVSEI